MLTLFPWNERCVLKLFRLHTPALAARKDFCSVTERVDFRVFKAPTHSLPGLWVPVNDQ